MERDRPLDQIRRRRGRRGGQVGKTSCRITQFPFPVELAKMPGGWSRLSGYGGKGSSSHRLQDHGGTVQRRPHQGGRQNENYESAPLASSTRE